MVKGDYLRKTKDEAREEAEELVREIKDIVGVNNDRSSGFSDVFKQTVRDLSKAPAPKQLAVGAVVGWATGYVTMKVGKMAATAIGGSLLLLQIAHHKGYIKVNWNQVCNDSSSLADRMKDKFRLRTRNGFEKFQDFAGENVYLAGGFTGGFFLGIASS